MRTARYVVSTQELPSTGRRAVEVLVDCDGARATWREVLSGLQAAQDSSLRIGLQAAIAGAPFSALFWETNPIRWDCLDRLFECVLVESGELSRVSADPSPFTQHFVRPDGPPIRSFANLGRDALLIVPYPTGDPRPFAHLAAMMRSGPQHTVDRLWHRTGKVISSRLKRRKRAIWVSTSGLGVSWVHIRLDDQPKYITWAPFRQFSS